MRIIFTSIIFIAVVVALVYVGSMIVSEMEIPNPFTATSTPSVNLVAATSTVKGEFTCLPHLNTEGPQTMECAYGLKGNDGYYYAIDFSDNPTSAFDLPMGRQYSVTGFVTPKNQLQTNNWGNYNIVATVKVSSYAEDVSDIPSHVPNTQITLELKKPVIVASTTIRIQAVTEDSRCPSDVQCIQAGRVVVLVDLQSPSGPSSTSLEIGKAITTETLSITLDDVTPYPNSKRKTTDEEYRFVLSVKSK